jgi:spoIIIJ-associated protein
MEEDKTILEVIAPSVEEAITQGLKQLNLPREAVEVDVLDSGSRGLFGIGNRQARIRLTVISFENYKEKVSEDMQEVEEEEEKVVLKEKPALRTQPLDDDQVLEISKTIIEDLLEKMQVSAKVNAQYVQGENPQDQSYILVDIQGNDLSILIGRRSETLNALQYISSLIIGKEVGHWVPIRVDVQGYRERRERQIRQMARRMADQAIHTGRKQVLEPMPANERRLVHIELRDNPEVTTESIGEEPNRKVTISLKK